MGALGVGKIPPHIESNPNLLLPHKTVRATGKIVSLGDCSVRLKSSEDARTRKEVDQEIREKPPQRYDRAAQRIRQNQAA